MKACSKPSRSSEKLKKNFRHKLVETVPTKAQNICLQCAPRVTARRTRMLARPRRQIEGDPRAIFWIISATAPRHTETRPRDKRDPHRAVQDSRTARRFAMLLHVFVLEKLANGNHTPPHSEEACSLRCGVPPPFAGGWVWLPLVGRQSRSCYGARTCMTAH